MQTLFGPSLADEFVHAQKDQAPDRDAEEQREEESASKIALNPNYFLGLVLPARDRARNGKRMRVHLVSLHLIGCTQTCPGGRAA